MPPSHPTFGVFQRGTKILALPHIRRVSLKRDSLFSHNPSWGEDSLLSAAEQRMPACNCKSLSVPVLLSPALFSTSISFRLSLFVPTIANTEKRNVVVCSTSSRAAIVWSSSGQRLGEFKKRTFNSNLWQSDSIGKYVFGSGMYFLLGYIVK